MNQIPLNIVTGLLILAILGGCAGSSHTSNQEAIPNKANAKLSAQDDALYEAAIQANQDGEYETAAKKLMSLADRGHAKAQLALAIMYQKGLGVTKSDEAAFRLLLKSAKQGVVEAQQGVAVFYDNGAGVERNFEKAFYWFHKAAEQGDVWGMIEMAKRYDVGRGVTQDHAEASKWWQKAANTGSASAMLRLALRYKDGKGVEKNDARAFYWAELSAKNSNPFAQNYVALAHYFGLGTRKDIVRAYVWARIASDSLEEIVTGRTEYKDPLYLGEEAKDSVKESANKIYVIAKDLVNRLRKEMSRTQVAEAERRIRSWYASKRNEQDSKSVRTPSLGLEVVELKKVGGVYEIPVELNGVLKIDMIFDSGASDISIAPDMALTLVRTGTITEKDWLEGKYYQFADGTVAKSKRFNLRSIKIGTRVIENVTASISENIEAPMLLGQSGLTALGRYTFDYERAVLILH